jgi:ribose/xylose/arabinose/galactoside ABC-type transport system permease subunit
LSKSNSNMTSTATPVGKPALKGSRKAGRHIIQYGIFVIFAVFYVIVTILRPGFLSLGNLYDIFIETSIISFVSFGEAIVIAAGGLDLSVGTIASAAAMLTCHLMSNLGYDTWVSIVAGVAIGGLIGLGNGLMVTRLYMNSLIATLGMMFVLYGFVFGITGGVSVHIVPDNFMYLGNGTIMHIPVPIYVMATVFVLAFLFMEKTSYGRSIIMIGGNIEACRLSGVKIKNLTLLTFVICGFLSTFSGILLAARQAVGNVDLGERFLLEAFIAAMLGTVIFNGKNVITGTLLGAIFLISMINGLTLLGAGPQWMYFSQGGLLLSAIIANYYSKRSVLKIPGLKK